MQKHLQLFCFQYLSNIISPEGDKPSWGWWGGCGGVDFKIMVTKTYDSNDGNCYSIQNNDGTWVDY